jgi:predicted alpha-1,2-mannosidase
MKLITLLLTLLLLYSCNRSSNVVTAKKDQPLTSYVNTFIGTGGHGHTYPGASLPFGMVQLSPDTRLDGWDGCSGYHYSDSYIYGFSHTHLSGTGVSDYGDVLLMPTNVVNFNNGADGKAGYRAHFSHEDEEASPGFYKVILDSTQIKVELTTTTRAGMHRYHFPEAENQYVIIDLEHRDKLLSSDLTVINAYELKGHRFSEAWAKDQRLFFHIKSSTPFQIIDASTLSAEIKRSQVALHFNNPNNEPVYISIGISAVDEEGAKKNLETEIGEKTFEQLKKEASDTWEKQLEKIVVESSSEADKTIFYSALYHTMIAPNLYMDVDGRYRGMDMEIHKAEGFDYYTVFSLWDTYRAANPLYTLIEPQRTNDFIQTFLAKYDEGGIMPIWDLAANYTGCMIGYHAVPVIADAYLKGIRGFNAEKALQVMKHSALQSHLGLESYRKLGFIPVEEESESVSKTLEYAYDDWTIAQMAKTMQKEEDYKEFITRAQNYKNVFDPETKFMRGRFRNTWFSPFDPFEVNFNYTEANAWQYSLYVPQDIQGLMTLMGGKDSLIAHMDELFAAKTATSGRDQADITGLIGQYAHGNEPSHHMAYLYNFVSQAPKTQEKVHQILTQLYSNAPDGISGNEDCGQMSAWYVFSSLGFYPVTPGSNQYIIGTPHFEKATIALPNNVNFTVVADGISDENHYILSASLNDVPLNRSFLWHDEIVSGGVLRFKMGSQPSAWGTTAEASPMTSIEDYLITPAPFIAKGEVAFQDSSEITLGVANAEATIFYSLNGASFQKYDSPFKISEETLLSAYALLNDIKSTSLDTKFFKIDPLRNITLKTEYANQYNGGGINALIDGIKGSKDFRTGAWQGYHDTDLVAIVDLGRNIPIDSIQVNFLQDQRSWIFFPTTVSCFVSDNPYNFNKELPKYTFEKVVPDEETQLKPVSFAMQGYSARYIKIIATNLGDLPQWHLGHPYDGKAWLFVDEIDIK